jgi:hypothetical protein
MEEDKDLLIGHMNGKDHERALQAVASLRQHKWLEDGTLRGINLQGANLERANLIVADLRQCDLSRANLQHANLTQANLQGASLRGAGLQHAAMFQTNLQDADLEDADLDCVDLRSADLRNAQHLTDKQLVVTRMLRRAIMPGGSQYDGRYNLPRGIKEARNHNVAVNDPQAMADWYGVPLETYRQGQAWAREHLSDLRGEHAACP